MTRDVIRKLLDQKKNFQKGATDLVDTAKREETSVDLSTSDGSRIDLFYIKITILTSKIYA